MSDERTIADALGKILGRGFRAGLYDGLTSGIADGLDASTYAVFSSVARAEAPPSAREIALEVGTDRSVVSRRAATLVSAGLIEHGGGSDPRAVYFALTESGERAASVMRERLDAAIAEHLEGWSREDVSRFARLLTAFGAKPL